LNSHSKYIAKNVSDDQFGICLHAYVDVVFPEAKEVMIVCDSVAPPQLAVYVIP